MPESVLIPLPGFELPRDFARQVNFIGLVNDQLRRLRATGHFLPPRFFGYYFQGGTPMGVGGNWTVTLDTVPHLVALPRTLDAITLGQYSIESASRSAAPKFMLVHDSQDGACWLWEYAHALRFIEAEEPVSDGAGGRDDALSPRSGDC